MVTKTTLTVPVSAFKRHNVAQLQIFGTHSHSFKVHLSLSWQRVSAEPSELRTQSLRMISELVLTFH